MCRYAMGCVVGLALVQLAGCPYVTIPSTLEAHVQTSLGEFVVLLYPEHAPTTVANFLRYMEDDFYDGTIFHRAVPEFVVQGGGFTPNLVEKETRAAIVNESFNGLSNLRGTVAMARTADPDSAAAQFFVNVADNVDLDADAEAAGYAVFGEVVEGMEVVDRIATTPTEERQDFADVPVEDVVIQDITLVELSGEGLALTPAGQAYLQEQQVRTLTLVRELLVQLVAFGITGLFG